MTQLMTRGRAREVTVRAVITRADGSTETLGTISYWHRNPFKRLLWRLKTWLLS